MSKEPFKIEFINKDNKSTYIRYNGTLFYMFNEVDNYEFIVNMNNSEHRKLLIAGFSSYRTILNSLLTEIFSYASH